VSAAELGAVSPEQVNQMTAEQMRDALRHVVRLCNSYASGPPPIFQGPGLSEHGKGYNAGMQVMAQAVLSYLAGEPKEDLDCCAECADEPDEPCCEIGARVQRGSQDGGR